MKKNMRSVLCLKTPITYTLLTKKVKNINLRIAQNGEIVVSANPFVAMEAIDDFVSSKAEWIQKHQSVIKEKSSIIMLNNEQIVLFGKRLQIKKSIAKINEINYDDNYLYVEHRINSDVKKLIQRFIDSLCKDVYDDIAHLTHRSLHAFDLPFPTIKIRDMKSRWGSCTPSKNSLTLNKKLVHYPFEFIEYVMLHEFVHFIHPNHSKDFYQVIAKYMPDYKKRMKMITNME